jgi:hypothetical protein
MKTTAHYVADLIGAKSLCIFFLDEEGFFKAIGIAGEFPLCIKLRTEFLPNPDFSLKH